MPADFRGLLDAAFKDRAGDRIRGAVERNRFAGDAEFGELEGLDTVPNELGTLSAVIRV